MDFLRMLAEARTPGGTAFFRVCTWFGEEVCVVAVLCLLFWCIDKRAAYRISFAYFASGLAVQILKITFRIERPWVLDPEFLPVEGAMTTATGYSFPSGHTQAATAMYGTLFLWAAAWQTKQKVKKILCCFFSILAVVLVGMSRMYLGVHTPKDVFVSFAVSFVLVLVVSYLYNTRQLDHHKKIVVIVLMAISVFAVVYALVLGNAEVIPKALVSDCAKAGGAGVGFAVGWYIETGRIQFLCRGAWRRQVVRYFSGIAVTLLLKSGLKIVLGDSLPANAIRYFLVVLWIMALFPAAIKAAEERYKKR